MELTKKKKKKKRKKRKEEEEEIKLLNISYDIFHVEYT